MLRTITTAYLLLIRALPRRVRARFTLPGRRAGQRGSVTLEQVIIALGLFLLATAVVAGLTAVVMNKLGQIN